MVRSLHRLFACACVAAGAAFLAVPAHAATLSYDEISNEATRLTTTYAPSLDIQYSFPASPYGAHTVTTTPGGWIITFSPSDFKSSATNATGGMTQETDGKLSFTVSFDSAITIAATLNESGHYFTTGNGTVSLFSGGDVFEAINPLPNELTGNGHISPVFNQDHTWSATESLGTFQGAYTSYHFSIDNDLFAESLASNSPGSACISKDAFSITILTGGGGPSPTPLPLASVSGLGLGMAALMLRKRVPGLLASA